MAAIQEKMIVQRGSAGGRAGRRRSGLAGREVEKKATIKKFETAMDPEREKETKRRYGREGGREGGVCVCEKKATIKKFETVMGPREGEGDQEEVREGGR